MAESREGPVPGWLLVLPNRPAQRIFGAVTVRLVDGCGNSTLVLVPPDAFGLGGTYDVPRPTPYDLTAMQAGGLWIGAVEGRARFCFTGEDDRDGVPLLRLEGSGFPDVRYR